MNNFVSNTRTSIGNNNTIITDMGPAQDSLFSGYEPVGSSPQPCMGMRPSYQESLDIGFSRANPLLQAGRPFAGYPARFYGFQQNETEIGGSRFQQTDGLTGRQQEQFPDPNSSILARKNSKLDPERSFRSQQIKSGSSLNVSVFNLKRRKMHAADAGDPYNFNRNKRLVLILEKELQKSDLRCVGRIVLPKRDAEGNLPCLSDKEGIWVWVKDLCSHRAWRLKYKYWSNKKGRIYVLEYARNLIKEKGLEVGDSFTLYKDESENLYFTSKKAAKPVAPPSCKNEEDTEGNDLPNTLLNYQADNEEDVALTMLIENFYSQGQQEADSNLMALPMTVDYGGASASRQLEEAKVANDHQSNI